MADGRTCNLSCSVVVSLGACHPGLASTAWVSFPEILRSVRSHLKEVNTLYGSYHILQTGAQEVRVFKKSQVLLILPGLS